MADKRGKRFGKWIRKAAARFLADLERAGEPGVSFYYDAAWASRACRFIELLPHVEGEWLSPTIKLEPPQVFFVAQLFGFRNLDGRRRFTTALFGVARKNAKSTLAAAILLVCYCLEDETGPQVLSAATTGDQARIVWSVAARMVQRAPKLREHFDLRVFANAIARRATGGTFRPINAKASTQDGLNPSALCFDELHAHKTRDLFDVLRSAAGSRKNPLFLYTTTEGYLSPGPWLEVRAFAFQVLEGVVEAEHVLAVYYALDKDDDDFDEAAWIKANPLLGVSVSLEKLREYATEAKQQPGALAEFQIKRLNRQAAAAEGWVNLHAWKSGDGPVVLEDLVGQPCFAAFDLASTRDLTAWRLLWQVDGVFYTWGRNWVPEWQVRQRSERGAVRYEPWVAGGWIQVTPGDVADYERIQQDILADCARFQPLQVAFDPWNAAQMANALLAEGLPLVKFIQGPRSYSPAMNALERAYTAGKLRTGGDPVLAWNAANLVARTDVNLNRAPDKKRSADKIDAMVALLMAFGLADAYAEMDIGAALAEPLIVRV